VFLGNLRAQAQQNPLLQPIYDELIPPLWRKGNREFMLFADLPARHTGRRSQLAGAPYRRRYLIAAIPHACKHDAPLPDRVKCPGTTLKRQAQIETTFDFRLTRDTGQA
jgi:hypothetical protein